MIDHGLAVSHDHADLKARVSRLEHLLSANPAIIYTRDPRAPLTLTFISDDVRSRLGYDARELVESPGFWLSIVHPDDAPLARTELSGSPVRTERTIEYRMLHRDGTYRWIRDESKLVSAKDRAPEIIGCWVDVTKVKETELMLERLTRRLARSNRELEQFAYVASHDLRAPLRAIDTLSTWLEQDLGELLQGEAKEQMRLLRGRVRRMDRLLADLLDYARVGRVKAPTEIVDVEDVVAEVVDLSLLDQSMKIELKTKLPRFVTAKVPLKRVLMNLLSNAAKHNDRANGVIEISSQKLGDFYEFEIKDDGPGIAAQFHERVFQMFQTLKPRDTTEGSGMGLALVRRIVESAGGKITVQSEGRGCSFKFTWPHEWKESSASQTMRAARPGD